MNEQDIIKALMENWRPFGCMHDEPEINEQMQEKAKDIGKDDFFFYSETDQWKSLESARECAESEFFADNTYRLRPDYEPEPEVVKCEIKIQPDYGYLYIDRSFKDMPGQSPIEVLIGQPDFIGIEVDNWLFGMFKHKETGQPQTVIQTMKLKDYEVCDMSKAKVLFRSKK